jgi:hypothetical protein
MPDQFRELKPGDKLPGLPTQPWNKFLEREKARLTGAAAEASATSAVEVLFTNNTGAALDVYAIVGLEALNTYAADPDTWRTQDVFGGGIPANPASTSPGRSTVAILQTGLGPNEVGRARLAGRSACRVDLTDVKHQFATPTDSSARLKSASGGPIRIVALEKNWTETGEQWAIVILAGNASGFARFMLTTALSSAEASKDNCTVLDFWGGCNPGGSSIKVWNLPAKGGTYVFNGAEQNMGLATYDPAADKWWIIQMECGTVTGGGGGGTGFTGTIGD